MENGHLWENPCSRRASLPSASFDILPREYLLFGGGGAGNQDDLEEDPYQWPCYRITLAHKQQRSGLCERCPPRRRDAKKPDGCRALGIVVHPPPATAAIPESPDPGVQIPAAD